MTLVLFFIFGLIIGSFLNVVIFRLAKAESFLFGHSHCQSCNHELGPSDLIPVFSFVYLRGKCRYCKAKISWQYPIVELLSGLVFLLFGLQFGVSVSLIWFLVLASFLLVIAVFDLKHYLILDKVIFPALALALLRNFYQDFVTHTPVISPHSLTILGIISALIISGFFLAQFLLSRGRWIGLGDVKLGLLLGLLAPWPQAIALLLLAYFLGAIAGIGLILAGHKNLGSKLPFGVFLGLSAIITMLYGTQITGWYLKFIGL